LFSPTGLALPTPGRNRSRPLRAQDNRQPPEALLEICLREWIQIILNPLVLTQAFLADEYARPRFWSDLEWYHMAAPEAA